MMAFRNTREKKYKDNDPQEETTSQTQKYTI